jgi:hypothetical protein
MRIGNPGRVDNYGFVRKDMDPWPLGSGHITEQIVQNFSTVSCVWMIWFVAVFAMRSIKILTV